MRGLSRRFSASNGAVQRSPPGAQRAASLCRASKAWVGSTWVELDGEEVRGINMVEAAAGGYAFARVKAEDVQSRDSSGVHLRKAYHYAKLLEAGTAFPPVQVQTLTY
jgi:hypothetical protein